jgi:O-antigen/teichoic acid export membrane protein
MIANFAGSSWASLMSIIFVPVYIKFMGIEAYGLVGVFASLLALFSVLDMGLGATMTREMARLSALDPTHNEARGLARTIEIIYWVVGIFLGFVVIVLAAPIADHWVKPDRLDPQAVKQALMITGGIVAVRWPASIYSGGLRGLDRQPLLNVISGTAATVRGLGAVAVLWLISPTIQAFFLYQIIVSAVETSCLGWALWRSLPGSGTSATFAVNHLKRVWQFSAGMAGITFVVLLLTQTDKIILSRMLPLDLFGYYTLAWSVSAVLLQTIGPIDAAVYPTLTRLVSQQDERGLREMYHKTSQMQAVILVPAALVLILFGDVVLMAWSGNPEIVRNTGPILSILAIGTCLNGFMHVPYFTQLAYGWTSLAFWQNAVSVIVLVPLMVVLTRAYGGVGAAYVWVILNAGYVLIAIHIMHRRILPDVKRDWYVHDIALPTAAALAVAIFGKVAMPEDLSRVLLVLYVTTVSLFCCLAAVIAAPLTRVIFLGAVRRPVEWARSRHKSITGTAD